MSQRSSFARSDQRFLALNSLVNAPPRPIELDRSSADISLAVPSPGLTDFRDLHSSGHLTRSSHSNDAVLRPSALQQIPLVAWYESPTGPWDPIHGRNRNVRTAAKLNYLPRGASFSEHRSHFTSPSECETTALEHVASDSGYGSLARQSVAGGSFHGDHDNCGDTTSVSSHLAGLHFDRPSITLSDAWGQQAVIQSENTVASDTNGLICPHCKEKVKTKSELKKHNQKHTKPYHCEARDCSRTEGFGTPNDVDRHVRSCHPELGSKGKSYKCTVDNCRSKDKKWPRADNFRQHLKRVHRIQPGDEDLEKYVYRAQVSPGPDLAGLGTSVGDSLMSLNIGHDGMASNPWAFSMQSVPEQVSRDSHELNDYMDHHLAQRDAVIEQQQHFSMMSRATTQVSNNRIQMPPLELDPDSPMTQLEQAHSQSQRLQAFTASSIGDQETDFEGPDFFNNASISDGELDEDEGQSVIHHVSGSDSIPAESPSEGPRILERPTSHGLLKPSAVSAFDDARGSAINVDDESFSITSASHVLMPSDGDKSVRRLSDPTVNSEARSSEARLDVSDAIGDQDRAYGVLKAYEEQGLLAGLLEKFGYQKPTDAEPRPKTDAQSQRDVSKNVHACSSKGCKKSFPRQCELRKHMKRHAKPYGCTFPRCDKRFGSKNDWKRHENSQHYQLELWKCNEKNKVGAGEQCNKPFNRREQFKTHLLKDHGIDDATEVDQKLEDCLDGRNYVVQFWCGFCRTMVKVKETGLEAWLGRFNHIDDHFSGQMDISDWKSPGAGMPEVDFFLAGSNKVSHSGLHTTAVSSSARPDGGGRRPKRDADEEAPQPKPPKKARPNAVWYCCGCGNQSLMGFSAACLNPSCRGHEQCGSCRLDAIPVDNFENGV